MLVIGSGVLFAMIAVAPDTTNGLIPSFHTFSTFWDLLGRAPHVLRAAIVPVSPRGPALLLALVALWAAGAAAEWSARYLEGPLGAIGPSVALFVVITALGSGPWAGVTAVYILAVTLYLLFLHQDEATARRTWFQTARATPLVVADGRYRNRGRGNGVRGDHRPGRTGRPRRRAARLPHARRRRRER